MMEDLKNIINRLEIILTDLKGLESCPIQDVTNSQKDWIDFWENTDE
jgi:hypothetical protein|tara:strand:- start:2573 stop:2713 length:141 start_codon:yes stop_codon:yes gene_type:complete